MIRINLLGVEKTKGKRGSPTAVSAPMGDGGWRSALALCFCHSEQINSDHRVSKLLRAKPTATAIWPAFSSTIPAAEPLVGGAMRWKGFRTSTGRENS